MEPLQQLPERDAVFNYLKQNCLTKDIKSDDLRKISKAVANHIFNPKEIERTIKDLKLSIGLLQIVDIKVALQCCVAGESPIISKIQKNNSDYREKISIIRNRVSQQQQKDWKKYEQEVGKYGKKCAQASCGNLPEYPAKPLSNFLDIHSPKYPLLQVEKNSCQDEKMAIKTGDSIHEVLKEHHLEAFYLNEFKKIVVLASSNISQQELRLIFEKCHFKTGLYPVVENERTQMGDLMLHMSDKLPALVQSFSLPSEDKIFDYLRRDNIVKWYVSVHVCQVIAKKLERTQYIPQETLENFNLSLQSNETLLKPIEINILDKALMRCVKNLPPRSEFH